MRRLVVSCHVTVANYEYLVYWRFYQDGNIECEVRATGLMVTTPFAEGDGRRPTGTVVDERTYAPFHQHFLVARLDLDVDGGTTRSWRSTPRRPGVAGEPLRPGPDDHVDPGRSEAESARDFNWATQRAGRWSTRTAPTRTALTSRTSWSRPRRSRR